MILSIYQFDRSSQNIFGVVRRGELFFVFNTTALTHTIYMRFLFYPEGSISK